MGRLPILWLLTDERVAMPALLKAAARLPTGSGIIMRHGATPTAQRYALFTALRRIARRRRLRLLLKGTLMEAMAWGADGAHGPIPARRGRPLPPGFVRSVPVHDRRQLRQAERSGANLVFLSPLFATRSHPGAQPLGSYRFAAIARNAAIPVMALGGVGRRHRHLIRKLGASGHGAIDSLTDRY